MIIAKELNNTQPKVGGLIITFQPDELLLLQVIESAYSQVDFLYVVNNGEHALKMHSEKLNHFLTSKKINTIENGENLGVATALNIGLKVLINKGCTHFLMLDQDSLIPENMVLRLLESLHALSDKGYLVAAIGPAYFHSHLNKYAPFIQFGKLGLKKIQINHKPELVETHFLITSGSLVTLEALQNVGLMEDALFIDFVDTEWCLRAINKQYKIYGYSGIKMSHSLGDKPVSVFGRRFSMHSPLRHYYLVRNAIHLVKKSYIPLNWRLIILGRMVQMLFFYSLVPTNRLEHFRSMLCGIKDGLTRTLGRRN